jgi:hypothetical protein
MAFAPLRTLLIAGALIEIALVGIALAFAVAVATVDGPPAARRELALSRMLDATVLLACG